MAEYDVKSLSLSHPLIRAGEPVVQQIFIGDQECSQEVVCTLQDTSQALGQHPR